MKLTRVLFRNVVTHKHLGLQPYNAVLKTMESMAKSKTKQTSKAELIEQETRDFVLTCEHHPVYTVGIRTRNYMDQKVIEELKELNAEFQYTDRGGLITFHGPGQLICYPILNLKNFGLTVRCYIHKLEEVLIRTCKDFSIDANRTNDIGIWIGNDKVAAIGVNCRKYITTHGLALNCNTDLTWFDHIVPCGLHGKGVTSLSQLLHHEVTTVQALPVLMKNFQEVFQCSVTLVK